MQWLAEICVRRPVFAVMLILALVVAGLASYLQLGVDRFPKMDLPTVYVMTTYRGASAEEIESEVTQVLEDAVASVAGIDELRSVSREGMSFIILTFTLDRDIDAASQDVRDAVSAAVNRLPPDVDPPVIRKQDVDASPILTLAVSGQRDPRELYVLADRYVKDVIESAPGVGQVTISGAMPRAVQVNIEARRLAAYGLSIMQVHEALQRQNAEIRVDEGFRELGLRTLGRFVKPRDFEDMVVATVQGTPIRLRDLGEVLDATKEVRNLCRLDGLPAVTLQVQRQSGENTVEVIQAVKKRLQRSRDLLPPDVSIDIIQDQSRYIHAAMEEVQKHLIVGSILASAVVLWFLRSWRSTLIAAVAIPASIISTFAVMRALDFTLNNVTMLALVLTVGVVIDDAIVVLENIFHAIEEKHLPPLQAAVAGTKEIGLAVLVTTLSLVVVFLPVSFLSSVTGRMLFQFGVTATVAILVSMLVSFSLTPMMCSRLLRAGTSPSTAPASRRGFYRWVESGYLATLRWSMRHRWAVLLVSLGVIAANGPLYMLVKQDYIPTNVDESEFEVGITAPEGATIAAMDRTMQAVEAELRQVHGIRRLLCVVGTGGLARPSYGYYFVRLEDIENRTFSLGRLWRELLAGRPWAAFQGNFTQREKMLEVRRRLAKFPDLEVSVRNLTSLRQGAPVDIDFSIIGPDLQGLLEHSDRLLKKIKPAPGEIEGEVPGLHDAYSTLKLDKPDLYVEIDRERAAALGVDVAEVAETLRVAVGGDDRVSRYRDHQLDEVYDVELRLVGIDRGSREAISQIYVRTGHAAGPNAGNERAALVDPAAPPGLTRLDNVVRFRFGQSPARIDRLDRQRMAAVRANVAPGYALADRIAAIQKAADELGMPPSYTTRVMGRGRELERTFRDFRWTFLLSFIFMYLLLAAQFEHLVHPLTILVSLPLAVPFGLISLYLGGETLNLYSALGILVLFGVIKKNSILQVDHTNQLRARGMERTAAILRANRDRLRPILMTTISFVAWMLPMLFGTGPGAEERRSITVLVVGGQTLSLLLTLLAGPVVYSLFDDLGVLLRHLVVGSAPRLAAKQDLVPTEPVWEPSALGATAQQDYAR